MSSRCRSIPLNFEWEPRVRVKTGLYGIDFERAFTFNAEISRYIINENATILFWDDGTKTISKRDKEDKFDKELGFLYAYFYKKCGYSKTSRKKILSCIKENKIKEFLFEFYVKDSKQEKDKARKHLSNLSIEK